MWIVGAARVLAAVVTAAARGLSRSRLVAGKGAGVVPHVAVDGLAGGGVLVLDHEGRVAVGSVPHEVEPPVRSAVRHAPSSAEEGEDISHAGELDVFTGVESVCDPLVVGEVMVVC